LRTQLAKIAGVTAVAQLAAFFKLWLVARYFGVGAELDGYNLAFVGPTLVAGVLGAVLQTGLFPIYATLRARRGPAAVAMLERLLFWGLLGVGLCISLTVFFLSDEIAGFLAADGTPDLLDATRYVLLFAAFAIALNVVGDYTGYILALRDRFLIAAAAPIANALVGAVLLLAWPEGRLTILALGTLLGILTQVAIALWGAIGTGFAPIGPMRAFRDLRVEVIAMLRLGAWILPGTLFSNLVNALPPVLLVPYGEGAVSAFGYAFRFHQTAVQLVVMGISPILLSRFSDLVARGEWDTLERLRRKAFWLSVIMGAIALLFVVFIGEHLLTWLFAHGRFDPAAAERVAGNWSWLTAGLAAALYGNVLAKRLQADRQARALSLFAFASLLSFVLSAWALRWVLGEWAIPAALAVGALVPTFLMGRFLDWERQSLARNSQGD
jgi:peptidoglycan biosynthesis protein MviN/MurJ (putative lipid II flippase)